VDDDTAGAIVGYKGETVRQLRKDSNAIIVVTKRALNTPASQQHRAITIDGTPHEIATAKELIDRILRRRQVARGAPRARSSSSSSSNPAVAGEHKAASTTPLQVPAPMPQEPATSPAAPTLPARPPPLLPPTSASGDHEHKGQPTAAPISEPSLDGKRGTA
jgi:far upstream element-binding protein